MSEFECRNHHLMKSGDVFCRQCGEPLMYCDGMSRRQYEKFCADDREDDDDSER